MRKFIDPQGSIGFRGIRDYRFMNSGKERKLELVFAGNVNVRVINDH